MGGVGDNEGDADRGDPGAARADHGADTHRTGECAAEREPVPNGNEVNGKARADAANEDSE